MTKSDLTERARALVNRISSLHTIREDDVRERIYEELVEALRLERQAVWQQAAEIACNTCLCPADVAYDNHLPNQTQGDSYNMACLSIMDKLREQAGKEGAP